MTSPSDAHEVLRRPAFALFWSASTASALGSAVASVALQVLIVSVADATPFEIGLLGALSVVPYLVLGLVVGALMDRWRRKPVLVLTSLGRVVVFGAVPVLLVLGAVNVATLAAVILLAGVLTLFAESAHQPFLPRIVPRGSLVSANARLAQSEAVAGSAGPALGGALLTAIGAPFVFALEAVIHGGAALLVARIEVEEPRPAPRPIGRHLGHEIAEGMRFTYRHPTLAAEAVSLHTWFLGYSLTTTVFAAFVLRRLELDPFAFGVALAFGGVGGFAGAVLAPGIGRRLGAGHAVLLGRVLVVVPWAVLALAPLTAASGTVLITAVVAAGQLLYGAATGIEDTNEMAYRQAAAPDAMQGRLNTTIRTMNRVVLFFGALLAGALATAVGYRATIGIGALVLVVAAVVLAVSPFRSVRHGDPPAA